MVFVDGVCGVFQREMEDMAEPLYVMVGGELRCKRLVGGVLELNVGHVVVSSHILYGPQSPAVKAINSFSQGLVQRP